MVTSFQQIVLVLGAAVLLTMTPLNAELVKDFNQEREDFPPGSVGSGIPAGDLLFFTAGSQRGDGLWRTDGTEQGTYLVRQSDISGPDPLSRWAAAGDGELVFRDLFQGWLLHTDGTVEGTDLLTEGLPAQQQPRGVSNFVRLPSGRWVVIAESAAEGRELWSTDGTSAGTRLLDVVRPGEDSGVAGRSLALVGGKVLFFSSPTLGSGPVELREHSLWITDGTLAGTSQLADLGQGSPSFVETAPSAGGPEPSAVLFNVFGPGAVNEVWITDGSAGGTRRLDSLPDGSLGSQVEEAVVVEGDLFFTLLARGPSPERGPCFLFRTSGTEATEAFDFSDLAATTAPAFVVQCPQGLTTAGGQLYFNFDDGVHGFEPWASDGSLGGSHLIADLRPGSVGSISGPFVPWQGGVAFPAILEAGAERTLLASDGTAAGTRPIAERGIRGFVGRWQDRLVISLLGEAGGVELWQTDGTPAGEERIAVIESGAASSDPRLYLRLGDEVLLRAATEPGFLRIGTTDGTAAGTQVGDLTPGLPTTPILSPVKLFDGLAHFSTGFRLLRTDGTPDGTTQVAESTVFFQDFGKVGRWYVYPDDRGDGVEPWVSDGTPEGTFQLLDVFPGEASNPGNPDQPIPNSSFPRQFTRWGDALVFTAENEARGREVWITDGTPAGTRILETIAGPSPASVNRGQIHDLEVVAGRLFFTHSDSGLWVTDGTASGTRPVLDRDGLHLQGTELASYRGRCLLMELVDLLEDDVSLVLTDGSRQGTREIVTLPVTRTDVDVPVVVGDRIFFSLRTRDAGRELWTSDGTAAGTGLVTDLWPGPESSAPTAFVDVDGVLLFSARHPEYGRELWTSDGTAAGTRLLTDLQPGVGSSGPRYPTALGESVLFGAYREDVGRELFRIDRSALEASCRPGPRTLCLQEGRFSVSVDWRNQRAGTFGVGTALTYSDDTGQFWFFDEENVELLVKVLDGRVRNDHHWVFAGALTDAETWVTVVDHQTGKERTFHTPPRQLCGFAETRAFDDEDPVQRVDPFTPIRSFQAAGPLPSSVLESLAGEAGECSAGPDALLLQNGRFSVEVTWETARQGGRSGVGTPVPGTDKSGYFWFFNQANLELVVKILDGRPSNGRFWVLYGALSDVGYEITVTDLETCASKTYVNVEGNLCGRADVQAF